jgi:hypothetical protein
MKTNTSDEKTTKQQTHECHFLANHLKRYGWIEALVLFDEATKALQYSDEENRDGRYCEASDLDWEFNPRKVQAYLPFLSPQQIEEALRNLIFHGAFLQRGGRRHSLAGEVLAEVHESQPSWMVLVGAGTEGQSTKNDRSRPEGVR